MQSIKCGVCTIRPCHRCLLERKIFASGCVGPVWIFKDAIHMIEWLKIDDRIFESLFNFRSMFSVILVFSNLPLVEIHLVNNVFYVFQFEPLQSLLLRVSKLLKHSVRSFDERCGIRISAIFRLQEITVTSRSDLTRRDELK